jgi:hypothetical protein
METLEEHLEEMRTYIQEMATIQNKIFEMITEKQER